MCKLCNGLVLDTNHIRYDYNNKLSTNPVVLAWADKMERTRKYGYHEKCFDRKFPDKFIQFLIFRKMERENENRN